MSAFTIRRLRSRCSIPHRLYHPLAGTALKRPSLPESVWGCVRSQQIDRSRGLYGSSQIHAGFWRNCMGVCSSSRYVRCPLLSLRARCGRYIRVDPASILPPPLSYQQNTPSGFFLDVWFSQLSNNFSFCFIKHHLKITRQSAQLDNPERINIYGCWWTVRLNIKGRACSAVKMKLKIHRRSFSTWRLIPSLTPLAIHRW